LQVFRGGASLVRGRAVCYLIVRKHEPYQSGSREEWTGWEESLDEKRARKNPICESRGVSGKTSKPREVK